MSDIIAILNDDKWEFYGLDVKPINSIKYEADRIYAVLPDDLFFFFQTDITSKRKASIVLEAYVKSTFPLERGFVGFYRGNLPLIGYIFFEDRISDGSKQLLDKAYLVTTPFALYLTLNKNDPFVYDGNSVCAIYDGLKLRYYTFGDECLITERLQDGSNFKRIKYETEEIVKELKQLIVSKNAKQIGLNVIKEGLYGFGGWKLSRFVAILVVVLLFVSGGVLKYKSYSKRLEKTQMELSDLYKKALGDKNYSDPFGVLLYKADENSLNNSVSPMRLLYALSKAKDELNVRIDYISLTSYGVKVRGYINNYSSLLKYLNSINRLLHKNFIIQNTSSANDRLEFSLVWRSLK